MTKITLQDGKVVLRAGKVGTEEECCCQCDPCSLCLSPCLEVTLSGFDGVEEPCDECDYLDGTYVLKRGAGFQPQIDLTVKATTGYGAVLTPVIGYDETDGSYSITSVTIDKAGTCYSADASIVLTVLGGFVACGDDPLFSVTVDREEPLLDLSDIDDIISPAGTGADLTPVYTPAVTTAGSETWSLDSVTVTASGVDYDNLAAIDIKTKGCTVTISPASARVRTVVSIPVQSATFIETTGGSGASVSVTWSPRSLPAFPAPGHLDGIPHWDPVVSASGGTGYAVNDNVKVTFSSEHYSGSGALSPQAGDKIVGTVTSVDVNGAITGVSSITATPYYRSDGSIDSIEVLDGGEYYTPGGIESVAVLNPGTIWPDEACRYTLCEPTDCKYGDPEESKCRTITLLAASDGYHITISHSPPEEVIYSATLAPEGNKCSELEYTSESITESVCSTDGTITVTGVECDGPPPEDSCCYGCPDGGLCPCPGSGIAPLFTTGWPGELSPGSATVDCDEACQYLALNNGLFNCEGVAGQCDWDVTVCADIKCASKDFDSGCGSDCTLVALTVTVDTDLCDCPGQLPDFSSFDYFYCP